MLYQSTRGKEYTANAPRAILDGLAPDGGLYMIPDFSGIRLDLHTLLEKNTVEMAAEIIQSLMPDFSISEMRELCRRAYEGKFETPDLTPLAKVGDRFILELFHGPTSAFKDVALSMLPQLMTAAREKVGLKEEIVILTATSGDTGKAALEGFHDVPGVRIIVFYPNGGVSPVQRAQMVTQTGNNVDVIAVNGNFDDAQTGVKTAFQKAAAGALKPEDGAVLSSANSINIGRLAPQIVYYFKAYADLLHAGEIRFGEPVTYVVPTGNFGDILAGYFAKKMGLPVGKLVCASNKNKVLTDFFETGRYDRRREFYKTTSPSMDILVSSNLERLLYMAANGDTEQIAALMNQLSKQGYYDVPESMRNKLAAEFSAGWCDDARAAEMIGKVWKQYGYLMDPHTAVAWAVSEDYCADHPAEKTVVLSTASPFKFPSAVLEAIGETPDADPFRCLNQMAEITGLPVPRGLENACKAKVLHTAVVEKDSVADYALQKARKR